MEFKALTKKILRRIKREIKEKTVKLKTYLFDTHISLKKLQKLAGLNDRVELTAQFKQNFSVFLDSSDKAFINDFIKNNQAYKEEILKEADGYLKHEFDLLGSGPTGLNTGKGKGGYKFIDWQRDFKSGYLFEQNKFYRDIKIPVDGDGVDIKVPWELSRLQHLPILVQAYLITDDEKYAVEIINQLEDWIDSNRPMFGVNWVCTMDVGIRIANMLAAYEYIKDSPNCTGGFSLKFIRTVYEHGSHIINNLEWSEEITSNHYLSDIAGLLFVSVSVPIFKESSSWRDFALEELIKEMEKQVYADGVDFEGSTCYHRLVLELFFYSAVLCRNNNISLPPAFLDKLYKMLDFEYYLIKPNGKIPQIGDNDSGRLFKFTEREVLDHSYLLCLGSIFFREPKWKRKEFGYDYEALWVLGQRGKKAWDDIEWNENVTVSKAFKDAGFYIMRDKDVYLFISCGPNGQNGNGGHGHNDKLSFELCIGGEDFIIDPGTYLYTPEPEWRNKFRSTAWHNTLQIGELEQNEITNRLFFLEDTARAEAINWKLNEAEEIFAGCNYGFKRAAGIEHIREFILDKRNAGIIVKDYLKGSPAGDAKRHLILPSVVEIEPLDNRKVLLINKDKRILIIFDEAYHITEGYVSKEYGKIQKTRKIEVITHKAYPEKTLQFEIFFGNENYECMGDLK